MNSTVDAHTEKFGVDEIHAIRDRWAEMPYEKARAERQESFIRVMRQMHGPDWKSKLQITH